MQNPGNPVPPYIGVYVRHKWSAEWRATALGRGASHSADGVIDHHVQPAQGRNREPDQGIYVIDVRDVAATRDDVSCVIGSGGFDQVFQTLLVDVAGDHLGAFGCESSGGRPPVPGPPAPVTTTTLPSNRTLPAIGHSPRLGDWDKV